MRKEQVQLDITIITDESKEFAKLLKSTDSLISKFHAARKKGEDVSGIVKQIADSGKAVEKIDLSKLTPAQLIRRAKTLQQIMRQIPQSSNEYKKMASEVQRLNTKIKESRLQTRGLGQQTKKTGGLFSKMFGGALSVFAGNSLFSIAKTGLSSMISLGKESIRIFDESAKANAQTKAVLESTNNAAGRSYEQLRAQQKALSATGGASLFLQKDVAKSQNLLLTFTKIQTDVFDRTTASALDMSQALGQDLKASSIQLGKALNDPIKGVGALSEVGVSFSQSQKDMIKTMQETNNLAGAQNLILDVLDEQFKGSAKAATEAGLGGFQVLKLRMDEVKSSVGLLVNRGFKAIQPVLRVVTSFLEKFVSSVVSGDKATGKMSGAVNFAIGIFKFLAGAIRLVVDYIQLSIKHWKMLIDAYYQFIKSSPFLSRVFNVIQKGLGVIISLVSNTASTTAALKAAFQQMVQNLKNDMLSLLDSANIFAKKFKKFFTFDSRKRSILSSEISQLEANKSELAKKSKDVWQTYIDVRDKLLAKNAPSDPAPVAPPSPKIPQPTSTSTSTSTASPSTSVNNDATGAEPNHLELRLKAIEAAHRKELLLARYYQQEGRLTETEYNQRILDEKTKYYQSKLDALAAYNQSESEQAIQAKIDLNDLLAEENNKATNAKLQANRDAAQLEQEDLAALYEDALLSENEYETARLEAKASTLEEELRILEEAGLKESATFRQKESEKTKAEKELAQKRQNIAKAEADFKKNVLNEQEQAAGELLQASLGFLARDEAARKKNAAVLKAFAVGQIFVNTQREISKIWATQGINPIVAGLRTAAALVRGVTAISKVKSQKFARGGFTGPGFLPPDSTGHRPVGIVHNDEFVAPKWQVESPVYRPAIDFLNSGLKGYAIGGPVGFNIPATADTSTQFDELNQVVQGLASVVAAFPSESKATVVLTDLQLAEKDYSDTLADASY